MWPTLLRTSVINHMAVQCSSQWMSPDDGDIRRRNICREIIIVNKSALVGEFAHILKMYSENSTKFKYLNAHPKWKRTVGLKLISHDVLRVYRKVEDKCPSKWQQILKINKNLFLSNGSTALVTLRLPTVEALQSHWDKPHSEGLPWTSDRPVEETST
jgi:hypothetical protein